MQAQVASLGLGLWTSQGANVHSIPREGFLPQTQLAGPLGLGVLPLRFGSLMNKSRSFGKALPVIGHHLNWEDAFQGPPTLRRTKTSVLRRTMKPKVKLSRCQVLNFKAQLETKPNYTL